MLEVTKLARPREVMSSNQRNAKPPSQKSYFSTRGRITLTAKASGLPQKRHREPPVLHRNLNVNVSRECWPAAQAKRSRLTARLRSGPGSSRRSGKPFTPPRPLRTWSVSSGSQKPALLSSRRRFPHTRNRMKTGIALKAARTKPTSRTAFMRSPYKSLAQVAPSCSCACRRRSREGDAASIGPRLAFSEAVRA